MSGGLTSQSQGFNPKQPSAGFCSDLLWFRHSYTTLKPLWINHSEMCQAICRHFTCSYTKASTVNTMNNELLGDKRFRFFSLFEKWSEMVTTLSDKESYNQHSTCTQQMKRSDGSVGNLWRLTATRSSVPTAMYFFTVLFHFSTWGHEYPKMTNQTKQA